MIFSNDRTTKDALLNTLGDELAAAWVRFYAIEVDSRPSMIGRSPPPRDWTPRSPSSSRHPEDGLRATGPSESLKRLCGGRADGSNSRQPVATRMVTSR